MAVGEYVSVSSQSDIEKADLGREQQDLESNPAEELEELTTAYEKRGLDKDLAKQVALQLTNKNALEAHAKEELGINEITKPHPFQAAMASAASFISGGLFPFLVALFAPIKYMVFCQYGFAIVFLALSGVITAKMGGCAIGKSMLRICFWGTMAMLTAAMVGYIFGVKTG